MALYVLVVNINICISNVIVVKITPKYRNIPGMLGTKFGLTEICPSVPQHNDRQTFPTWTFTFAPGHAFVGRRFS